MTMAATRALFVAGVLVACASATAPTAIAAAAPSLLRGLATSGAAATATQSWDLKRAEQLAQFCAVSYCPADDVRAWECDVCDSSYKVLNTTTATSLDMSAYVLVNEAADELIVVWEGTPPLSWPAWAEDLDVTKLVASSWCSDCSLHKGFTEVYFDMRTAIVESVQYHLSRMPNAKLIVTGHSLGAAAATLNSFDLATFQGIQPLVYTFGGPRVGNEAFSDAYADAVGTYYRVVHDQDMVPHLPWKIGGWYHAGIQVYCDTKVRSVCLPAECVLPCVPCAVRPLHLTHMPPTLRCEHCCGSRACNVTLCVSGPVVVRADARLGAVLRHHHQRVRQRDRPRLLHEHGLLPVPQHWRVCGVQLRGGATSRVRCARAAGTDRGGAAVAECLCSRHFPCCSWPDRVPTHCHGTTRRLQTSVVVCAARTRAIVTWRGIDNEAPRACHSGSHLRLARTHARTHAIPHPRTGTLTKFTADRQ